jgi:hypothetical protein
MLDEYEMEVFHYNKVVTMVFAKIPLLICSVPVKLP